MTVSPAVPASAKCGPGRGFTLTLEDFKTRIMACQEAAENGDPVALEAAKSALRRISLKAITTSDKLEVWRKGQLADDLLDLHEEYSPHAKANGWHEEGLNYVSCTIMNMRGKSC